MEIRLRIERNSVTIFQHIYDYIYVIYMSYDIYIYRTTFMVRVPGDTSKVPCSIFWEVVGLERGPLSLVSTIEELLGRKSSGSCL
jgi:hypothetical protein